ncbi:hypothetical protein DERP_002051 [Dermatophagoides pteronyssinus]|uniref:Uncharacterized protein n=1 Tax=Dermatophagoides pteronyssinus TaxID=6956 RepID=A0ABQ8JGN9_DERPT|nr:hypothetical protein DERP_002051 [Dermatophagoides pteronyssinus]
MKYLTTLVYFYCIDYIVPICHKMSVVILVHVVDYSIIEMLEDGFENHDTAEDWKPMKNS